MAGEGMNLKQDDPISLDMRNIMSEQLTELRMMRTDIKETAPKASPMGSVSAENNPYINNPYYTERHADILAMGAANVKYDVFQNDQEIAKSTLGTVANYANESGFSDVFMNPDRIVNGRGLSNKDVELAKMRFGDQFVNAFANKTQGLVSGGASLGSDIIAGGGTTTALMMAGVSAGAAVLPAMAVGTIVGGVVEDSVDEAFDDIGAYQGYRDKLYTQSSRFIMDHETDSLGAGFSKDKSKQAARALARMNSEFNISNEDMAEIFQGALDNDLLGTVSNVEEFEKKMKDLTAAVKSSAKSLGKTFSEVTAMMGDLEREGITSAASSLIVDASSTIGASLGMTADEFTGTIGATVANKTQGRNYDPTKAGLSELAMFSYAGKMAALAGERIGTAEERSGDLYLQNVTPDQLSADNLRLYQYNEGYLRPIVQASMEIDFKGDAVVNDETFKRYTDDLAQGKISVGDLTNIGMDNAKKQPGLVSGYEDAVSKYATENQMSFTAGFSGAMMQAILEENGMTDADYRNMAPAERTQFIQEKGQIFAGTNASGRMSQSEAANLMIAYETMGKNIQEQEIIGAYDLGFKSKVDSNSSWIGGATDIFRGIVDKIATPGVDSFINNTVLGAAPRYISKDTLELDMKYAIDYENLDKYPNALFGEDVSGQNEKVINTILLNGLGDTDKALKYQDKMVQNNFSWDLMPSEGKLMKKDIGVLGAALQESKDSPDSMMQYIKTFGGDSLAVEYGKLNSDTGATKQQYADLAKDLVAAISEAQKGKQDAQEMSNGGSERMTRGFSDTEKNIKKLEEAMIDFVDSVAASMAVLPDILGGGSKKGPNSMWWR